MGIALIPLTIVLVGIVQVAVFLYAEHVVVAAVEEGARVGSADGRTLDDGVSYAQQLLKAGLGPIATEVTISAHQSGEWVVVDGKGVLPLVIPYVPAWRLPLDAEAQARREGFRPGGSEHP
jgi:Flp pilus assembly protein TadG